MDEEKLFFFTEVTGTRVSDHYSRNIYIKVFLKIAVLRILICVDLQYLRMLK